MEALKQGTPAGVCESPPTGARADLIGPGRHDRGYCRNLGLQALRPTTCTQEPQRPCPTYCSAACRAKAKYDRDKTNGEYEAYKAAQRAKNAARREANARPCPYCGDPMTHPRRVQCGKPECKRLWTNERNLAWQHKHKAETGEWYQRRWAEQQSQRERELRAERKALGLPSDRKRRPAAYAKADAKRRMLKAETRLETSPPTEIFERDQWICGICKRPVDPTLSWPDPQSATLDHIVPISEGGEHTRANCRLAHLRCNSARRDRGGGEQLALIG